MLESNYRAWKEGKKVSSGSMDTDMQDSDADDTWDVNQVLEKVLQDTDTADKRAAKMDVDEFLTLLDAFHRQGIHFGG